MIETNFKHTDIGPIPHDWEVKTVWETAPLKRGVDLPKSELQDGPYPVVYSNGIGAFHSSYQCKAPGLITGRSGTLGKFTLIKEGYYWPHNTTLWVTDFKSNNPTFLFYLYSTLNFEESSTGTGVPTLNRNFLRDIKIPIPPLAEQEAIGKALSDIDGLIDVLRKLIEKKRNIKQGAMSRLLSGSLRLPGFNKPWKTNTLGEIGHLIPNNSLSWDCISNSGRIANIHYGQILTRFGAVVDASTTQLPFIHRSYETKFVNGNKAKDGDVIFADTAEDDTVGKAIELVNVGNRHIVSGLHTFWFRPDVEFANGFLGYAMNGEAFHSQIPFLATGTKVSSISKPNLLKLELHYPSDLAEQEAIAKVLTDMDAEIEKLEKKLAKYEQVKQGMMKQLLTGKIRLI